MSLNVSRQEPWALHRELWNELNRAMERISAGDTSSGATADWAPPVDIEESTEGFTLYADVPGVDPTTIEVTLEKGVLTLSGSREPIQAGEGVDRRRVERAQGRFHRRFTLPDTADADKVSARGHNGVLEVSIPKRAASQPRRITVNTVGHA